MITPQPEEEDDEDEESEDGVRVHFSSDSDEIAREEPPDGSSSSVPRAVEEIIHQRPIPESPQRHHGSDGDLFGSSSSSSVSKEEGQSSNYEFRVGLALGALLTVGLVVVVVLLLHLLSALA